MSLSFFLTAEQYKNIYKKTTVLHMEMHHLFHTVELHRVVLLVGVGGEDGCCTQKEKYLCGRGCQIHNIRQSEVRGRLP